MSGGNKRILQSWQRTKIRQAVEVAGTRAGPGLLNRLLSQHGNEPACKIAQISDRFLRCPFVKADFLFGRARQHAAIITRNQIPRSFVNNPRDRRLWTSKQHHLPANWQDARRNTEALKYLSGPRARSEAVLTGPQWS